MIIPNKSTSFKNSLLFKMLYILDYEFVEITVDDLYRKLNRDFNGIDEFIYSLDLLYVLDQIDVDDFGVINKCFQK